MEKIVIVFLFIVVGMPSWGWAQEDNPIGQFFKTLFATSTLDRLYEEGKQAHDTANYQIALEKWQAGLEQARALNNKRYISQFLTSLGNIYRNLGQYQRALEYYKQPLAIAREIGDRQGEGAVLGNIGNVYAALGQYPRALESYEQALAIAREIDDRRGEGITLSSIGVVYWSLGQYQDASTAFQESLSIHEALGLDALWFAQCGLAVVEARLNQPESAITHYEQALDTIETLRAGLTEKEQKLSFMRGKLVVYDGLINLLQDLHQKYPNKGYDRKALEIFERKQGRVFLEEMGQSGARNFAGISEEMLQQERELENQLEQTRKQLVDERSKIITEQNTDLIRTLEELEEKLKAEQTDLQKQIETRSPDYYALKYPKPASLGELQQKVLQPGELLLMYGMMKEQTCLWVVGKEVFGLYPLDIGEEGLAEKVETFRRQITEPILDAIADGQPINRLRRIAKRSMNVIRQTSSALSDLLLPAEVRPVSAKAETLYIVPTGALYGLPFEVLLNPPLPLPGGESQTGTFAVRYLIEDHAIVYLSSASLLKILRDAQSRKKEEAAYPLLAFANPVYNLAKVSEPSQGFASRGMQTRAYLRLMGGSFPELPDTEEEVKEIQAILQAPETSQPLQLRENASRSSVFEFHTQARLDDYRYVIFACHGILPGEINQVTQPALVLSLPDPKTQQDDYLTMADVFGLQFNADLITLSACNTGRGEAVKGEGVMGLTRAFMYAGTSAISITLWSVESQSAKTLSTGLYRHLKDGKSRAAALREIKLKMLHGEEGSLYQHPFFWAPVVIFGDGG